MDSRYFGFWEFDWNPSHITEEEYEYYGFANGCMHYIRQILGKPITITDAFRNPKDNKQTSGSASNSYHMWRTENNKMYVAIDFVVKGMTPMQAYLKLRKAGVEDKMIVYPAHIHINFSRKDTRLLKGRY